MVIETRKRSSPLKWVVIGLIVGAAIYWGPGLIKGKGGADQAAAGGGMPAGGAIPASTATVISEPVNLWSEFSGRIEAVDSVEIKPRVGGEIMSVHFKDGSEVKKGQLLFIIDPRPYEAALLSAKGAYVDAESSFNRAKKLIAAKAISQAELETRQGAYERALGAYQAAQVNMNYTRVTAPISGKISRAEITQGNVVEAGANAPVLASIVNLSPLYVSFELDEKTFLNTIQGVPADKLKNIPVELGLGNEQNTPIKANIHSFDNQIVPGSGTIRVRAVVPNKDQTLVPGLFARVRIGQPEETPSILINPTAVGTDQSKKFVLVVGEGNKAEYREVKLDGMQDGLQVVTDGLKEGETIVVAGLQRLRPGTPVQPQPVDMLTLKPIGGASDATATPEAAPAQ